MASVVEPRCNEIREALSALRDGEQPPMGAEVVRAHTARCPDCARFEVELGGIELRTRAAATRTGHDQSSAILTALAVDRAVPGTGRVLELRLLVAVAGVVQLALSVPLLVGVAVPDAHLGRDLGALQLALGIGFLLAARQPHRAAGVLPIAAVVAGAVVVTAVVDVVSGAASPVAELTHLGEIVGVASLWVLRRRLPAAPAPARALEAV